MQVLFLCSILKYHNAVRNMILLCSLGPFIQHINRCAECKNMMCIVFRPLAVINNDKPKTLRALLVFEASRVPFHVDSEREAARKVAEMMDALCFNNKDVNA